jgi:hypothetical protein
MAAELTDEEKLRLSQGAIAGDRAGMVSFTRGASGLARQQAAFERRREAEKEMQLINERLMGIGGRGASAEESKALRELGTPFATGAARGADVEAARKAGFFASGAANPQLQQMQQLQKQIQMSVQVQANVQPQLQIDLDVNRVANQVAMMFENAMAQRMAVLQRAISAQISATQNQQATQTSKSIEATKKALAPPDAYHF